jgi:hypothetical protein
MQQPESKQLGISDKSERQEVNAALAADLKVFARQKWPLSTDEWRMTRLANMVGVGVRRMKSLYQGEPTAVLRHHEAEAIAKLLKQRKAEEAVRDDIEALQERIARLETRLLQTDEEYHSVQLEGYRQGMAGGRGSNGSSKGADE